MKKFLIVTIVMAMLCAIAVPAFALNEHVPASRDDALNDALNVPGGELMFTCEEYPWVVESDYAITTNQGYDDGWSRSTVKTTLQLCEGDIISFDYAISSEPDDKLYCKANGEVILVAFGEVDWTNHRWLITRDALYEFEWIYEKNWHNNGGADTAYLNNVEIIPYVGMSFEEAINIEGGNIVFTREEWNWIAENDYVVSTNQGYDDGWSRSIVKATLPLHEGDVISFDYAVSSEPEDKFYFKANGETILEVFGEVDWTNFHWTATSETTYELEWIYEKNWHIDGGADRACLDNVALIPYTGMSFEEAVNVEGGNITFVRSDRNWIAENDYIISTAKNNGDKSTLTAAMMLDAGDVIAFDFAVSSAPGDALSFVVNGSTQAEFFGEVDWHNYRYTAAETGMYTFVWTYQKNYDSQSAGADRACLDNIQINPPGEIGDVNMNGSLDTGDAAMVLRYTVDLATMTDTQLGLADMNSDGMINTGDAALILRKSVGLA